jgi:hypothetical protein
MEAVISHADTEAGSHTVKDGRHGERLPTEHKQSGDRADMEQNQNRGSWPIGSKAIRYADDVGTH